MGFNSGFKGLTTILGRDNWSASRSGRFIPGKRALDWIEQDPPKNRAVWSPEQVWMFWKNIQILSFSRRLSLVHDYLPVSSYTTLSTDDVIINARNI